MNISPQTNHRHMEPREVARLAAKRRLRQELELSGIAQKAVAIECGVDHAVVSRWLADDHLESIPCWALPIWTREVGPGFASWLLNRAGLDIQGPATSDTQDLHTLTALLAGKGGATVQQLIQDMADGQWSEDERTRTIPQLRNLHTITGALLAQAEAV